MCFLFSRSEEVTVAKVAAAVKAAAAEEAAMVKVAEEVAVVNAVEEAMARTTTEEFVAVKSAAEATAVAGPDSSDGGGPIAVRTDTRGTPDVTPDYKALGKRLATMTGSIGTNPPPPIAFTAPGGMPCMFCRHFFFFLPTLCTGFLTLACRL
jgi:hypothetical protein